MQLMDALILMNVKTLRHVGEKSKAILVIHVKILLVHIFVIVMRDFDYLVQIVMI